jgi:hypothetical protein
MVAHKPPKALKHHAVRLTAAQRAMRARLRQLAREAADAQAAAADQAAQS